MVALKSFATPIVWVLALLLLGLILIRRGRNRDAKPCVSTRVGRCLLLTGTILLYILSLNPVANLLTYPLESQYQPPPADVLEKLDLVVVLGGGIHPPNSLRPKADLGQCSYPRFYHGVQVFRQSHARLLIFCGGPDRPGEEEEAETMRTMALSLGVPTENILAETSSRNTFENITNLARLLPEGQGRRIGLVTCATHMRRSHGIFCRQFPHDTIVPIPVQYTYDPVRWSLGMIVPSVGNLERSSVALHEWIGLAWYALRGR